jgi:hypothetical protein
VQKSRFQVTKTLKINIMKHSRNKYRSDDSFKITIRQVCSIARMLFYHCEDMASQIKHMTSRLKTSLNRNTYYIVCLGKNDRCVAIAFSGHQNAENRHNETLEK